MSDKVPVNPEEQASSAERTPEVLTSAEVQFEAETHLDVEQVLEENTPDVAQPDGIHSVSRQEMISAIVLLVFGLLIIWHSFSTLSFGSFSKPGSGFFPIVTGIIIAALSGIWLLSSLGKKWIDCPIWPRGERVWLNPVLGIALILLYILLIEPLGYLVATAVFMLLWQVLVARAKWWQTALITVLSTIAVYYVFVKALGVPMPMGILGF